MIIFLYGEDTFSSRKKLKELKEGFSQKVDKSGNSVVVVDGENASMNSINEAAGASSLFAKKRMIVMENLFLNKNKKIQEQVLEYIKTKISKNKKKSESEIDDDNVIIFWEETSGEKLKTNKLFKELIKQKFVQNFKPLNNTEILKWIKEMFVKSGLKINQQAGFLMASMFGTDLWRLNNEIEKIVNYKLASANADSGLVVEIEDIEKLSQGKIEQNIFALTDALSNKNKPLAIKLFEDTINDNETNEVYLLYMITRQFRILMQVRQALDNGHSQREMANHLKLHPFVVQKCLSQVKNFNLDALKIILEELIDIDRKIKSEDINVKILASLLISKI